MSVSVYIPSPFRRLTANRDHVVVEGSNVGEALDAVNDAYPGFDPWSPKPGTSDQPHVPTPDPRTAML